MAIDTPARLAVFGAGPIGLEATLYARFLGYDVVVYERGDVAESVRRWRHLRMFTPFAMNRSPLGLAAIQAHDETYRQPSDEEMLTGGEWLDRYILPLAQTDLIADHLRLQETVVAVGKEEVLQTDLPGHEDRGDWSFRVLSQGASGERMDAFDGVLDCTGVFANANWLGHGGIPALGEMNQRAAIEYRLPDILGADRQRYAGKHTLLIGAGASAATNAISLAALSEDEPATRVTWITRREGPAAAGGPVTPREGDPLPERAQFVQRANRIVAEGKVTHWAQTVVERVARNDAGGFAVELSGQHAQTIQVDEIIANVGFRPDWQICDELQIAHDPRRPTTAPPLVLAEPNYYVLGHKSYGRSPEFLFRDGLTQIRDVFRILGERETLDLYATARPLPR